MYFFPMLDCICVIFFFQNVIYILNGAAAPHAAAKHHHQPAASAAAALLFSNPAVGRSVGRRMLNFLEKKFARKSFSLESCK